MKKEREILFDLKTGDLTTNMELKMSEDLWEILYFAYLIFVIYCTSYFHLPIEFMKKIDTRKVQILKLIIEEYIQTGEITGSKSLLKKYDLQVSSATIRNDMAALEKMGLIFQPYNSAGRLPTTR